MSELFEIGFDIEFFCLPAFLVARCRKQDILMVEKLCSSAIHHPQYRTVLVLYMQSLTSFQLRLQLQLAFLRTYIYLVVSFVIFQKRLGFLQSLYIY